MHRFFADADVFADIAAIALQMKRVDEEDLARGELVRGEGEAARRCNGAARFPFFGPGAERLEAAGDGDLLRVALAFAPWEIGTDIDFESRERPHRERGVAEIADFFEGDEIGIEKSEIGMDRADLAIFLTARSVRAPAGEPLHIPEGGGDRGGGRTGLKRWIRLRENRGAEENEGERREEKPRGHREG